MIITFATQKGGVGKTTLAIAFANYLSLNCDKKVHVFDFDFQKSFYRKWDEDKLSGDPELYKVEILEDSPFDSIEDANEWTESDDIYIIDMAGALDSNYTDLLMYSNYIVIPFEYSDVSIKSTLVFTHILGEMGSEAQRIYIRSRIDKGFFYPNQEMMDLEISKHGYLMKESVYKRNHLQVITTRSLNYHQNKAVIEPMKELLNHINIDC